MYMFTGRKEEEKKHAPGKNMAVFGRLVEVSRALLIQRRCEG